MGRHLQRRRTRRESPPIELNNLADLALILVFAGLLVPQLVWVSPSDLIEDPGPAMADASLPRATVTITLTNGGGMLWNRDVVSWLELEQRVRTVKDHRQPPKLVLTGERAAPLGLNVDVRTLLRGTDFIEVALQKER
jgi:biopolymer transport protein ExbD